MRTSGLLTVRDAAERLSLSQATLRVWIAARRIACIRLGRAVRIPISEVMRLEAVGLTPARRKIIQREW